MFIFKFVPVLLNSEYHHGMYGFQSFTCFKKPTEMHSTVVPLLNALKNLIFRMYFRPPGWQYNYKLLVTTYSSFFIMGTIEVAQSYCTHWFYDLSYRRCRPGGNKIEVGRRLCDMFSWNWLSCFIRAYSLPNVTVLLE